MVSDRVVRYEIRNRIAWITLNRPEKRNAINTAMRKALQDAFTDLKHNADVWVAVLTGEATVLLCREGSDRGWTPRSTPT